MPNQNHLFQFKLAPVENIKPWGNASERGLSLSLYGLTDGTFCIAAGKDTLLQYTPEIVSRWGCDNDYADYQVACFARDVFDLVSAITAPISPFLESIVRDPSLLLQLQKNPERHSYNSVNTGMIEKLEVKKATNKFKEEQYNAFRWLGERTIWLNYFSCSPQIWFVRVGNKVWIQWDNVDRKFEGIDVWTARCGTYVLSVESFIEECHSFSERLLSAMEERITQIENGSAHAQIPLDPESLREQLQAFRDEFEKSLSSSYEPDIDLKQAEQAIRTIAQKNDITLPQY